MSNFGVIVGKSTLTDIGIGKSTPITMASPDPKDGRNESVSLLAVEQALAIASLSW
ncbi:hypothetical protein KRR40_02995 [Niabella defluvii]|nr:hypothetical protein KRR40_02995 [Niabella sp. I65]